MDNKISRDSLLLLQMRREERCRKTRAEVIIPVSSLGTGPGGPVLVGTEEDEERHKLFSERT
jgi:hypothetical protein